MPPGNINPWFRGFARFLSDTGIVGTWVYKCYTVEQNPGACWDWLNTNVVDPAPTEECPYPGKWERCVLPSPEEPAPEAWRG